MGSWDMDTAGTIDVSHGLSLVQYRKMTVVGITILVDDLNSSYPLPLAPVTGGVETGDGVVYFDTSVIRITRLATGFFDTGSFNDSSINRGYVDIVYGDI